MTDCRAAAIALLAVAAAALLAAGCGEDASGANEPSPLGPVRAGSVAQLAQCADWEAGTHDQRIAAIHDIRAAVNQAHSVEPTTDINDEDAYALLERACANSYASGFRLYKLYTRGAAFSSITGNPKP